MGTAIPVASGSIRCTRSALPLTHRAPAIASKRLDLWRSRRIHEAPLKWEARMAGKGIRMEGISVGTSTNLLVVGPGVLGSLVGRRWLQGHEGCKVVGETNTTNRHEELLSLGISPVTKDTQSGDKYPFVIFCAPPSGSEAYAAEVRQGGSRWTSRWPCHRRSIICMSTNGKPLNGNMNGSSESFLAYDSFKQAGIKPLGQGWDPWKQSGGHSGSSAGESDTSVRNSGGETSGRDDVDTVPRKTGNNKYGAVGNEGDEPFRILADGNKAYLDELDVLTLLVPPPFLKPMSTMNNYNHAAFLWKKIAAIPEERRHRLLDLLEPRHITAMWKMAELRYEDPGLYLQNPSRFLHSPALRPLQPTIWTGQVNEVPWIFNFLSRFKKAFFTSGDRELYGRAITGGSLLEGLGNIIAPLYFQVRPVKTVAATNEQCDFALSYDEGHFELKNAVPNAFPQPGKHPWPFGKEFFDYVRVVGPGVVAGQSWYGPSPDKQDPKNPGVGPRKYLGEFVLIQNYEKQIP